MEKQLTFLAEIQNINYKGHWYITEGNYWQNRIVYELLVAIRMLKNMNISYEKEFISAVDYLQESYNSEGVVTKSTVLEIEKRLSDFSEKIKEYRIICASQAHIDMHWMWGAAETAAVTLETFRTALDMMNEYPDFVFSQSQASVYEIVEQYDPTMLDEIRKRVKEKRWEVSASTWVEPDKNMPNGESMTRHILYTKDYLCKLLDLSYDDLVLDFEPDTFGHNINIPEILVNGGVKYFYHSRGGTHYNYLYRYRSPSGKDVLTYQDLLGYHGVVDVDFLLAKVDYFFRHNIKTALQVYGLGNHGGGPTRRDFDRIIDMNDWPLLPTVKFGSICEFFKSVEPYRDTFPIIDTEQNFVFDGCYTSQSRIKASNRIGENRLYQAEAINAVAANFMCSESVDYFKPDYFSRGWKNILFNHFHDILPGTNTVDSRESAMGMFQDTLIRSNTAITKAFKTISSAVNTEGLIEAEPYPESIAEGAGAGFNITEDYSIPSSERGKGKNRIYHVFNNTPYTQKSLLKLTLWDWPGNKKRLLLEDTNGTTLRFQQVNYGNKDEETLFWRHSYITLLVEIEIPSFGYNTFTLREAAVNEVKYPHEFWHYTQKGPSYILENDCIKAIFDTTDMGLKEFIFKSSGKNLLSEHKSSGLRFIREQPANGGTSWVVGRYMDFSKIENIIITETHLEKDALHQWIMYTGTVNNSKIKVIVSLDSGMSALQYRIEADWFEKGDSTTCIPQLNFCVPLGYEPESYLYDIPYGVIEREPLNLDVPGLSFICAKKKDGESLYIITKTKYGYRGYDNSISVNLLRSSYDPDPYPEIGIHKIDFLLGTVNAEKNSTLLKKSIIYNTPPVPVSGTVHKGTEPLSASFINEVSNIIISAMKISESGNKFILRVFEPDGIDTTASITFNKKIKSATLTDTNEIPITGETTIRNNTVLFPVSKYSVQTVMLDFD